jgi:hypothetical protein
MEDGAVGLPSCAEEKNGTQKEKYKQLSILSPELLDPELLDEKRSNEHIDDPRRVLTHFDSLPRL